MLATQQLQVNLSLELNTQKPEEPILLSFQVTFARKDLKETLAVLVMVPDGDQTALALSESSSSCSMYVHAETAVELGCWGPQQAAIASGQEQYYSTM